eukprot:SAG31_NODE_5595_length_2433_cov_2.247644_1_plen_30_part_10
MEPRTDGDLARITHININIAQARARAASGR